MQNNDKLAIFATDIENVSIPSDTSNIDNGSQNKNANNHLAKDRQISGKLTPPQQSGKHI